MSPEAAARVTEAGEGGTAAAADPAGDPMHVWGETTETFPAVGEDSES
jgi:hypothetical protein